MGDKIYNFFWWLAGARRDILAKHKNDHNKYFQMGMAVFMTACMAIVTGTFAVNVGLVGYEEAMKGVFTPWALLFGFFWGMVILSMDRTIVVTMQKQGNAIRESTPYQKWKNKKQEILPAIPRVLIALLIAKVVLDPFEVILYSQEITVQIEKDKQNAILDYQKERETKKKEIIKSNQQIIKEIEDKKVSIRDSIKDAGNQIFQLQNPLKKEKEECLKERDRLDNEYNRYVAIQMKQLKTGKGSNWRDAVANRDRSKQERDVKQLECKNIEKENIRQKESNKVLIEIQRVEIENYNNELIKLNKNISNTSVINTVLADNNTTAPISKKSSYNKALEVKEKLFNENEQYKHQHWVYMAFIFMIELLPIITKILANRGSYDAEMKNITERESARHDEELERVQLESKANIQKEALKHSSDYKIQETEYKKEISKKKNEPWFKEG